MPVTVRGVTQGARTGAGSTVAWPAGTAVGDLAILEWDRGTLTVSGPKASGWNPVAGLLHAKILTGTDLASPLAVDAVYVVLVTFAGAGGVGKSSSQSNILVEATGSGVMVLGAGTPNPLAPATNRVGTEWVSSETYRRGTFFYQSGPGYASLPGADERAAWSSVEILPASVPVAPTLVSPDPGGRVPRTRDAVFTWSLNTQMPQLGYRVRLVGSEGGRWVTAAGGLDTTETSVSSSQTQAVLKALINLSSDYSYAWSVSVQTSSGWSPYSPLQTVAFDSPPTFGYVGATSPFGNLSPVVVWEAYGGLSEGSPLPPDGFRVRITPSTSTDPEVGKVYDSGVLPVSPASHTVPSTTPWVRGQSYKAWVTAHAGGLDGTDSSAAFVVNWTPPTVPTLTTTPGTVPTVTLGSLVVGQKLQLEQQINGVWVLLTERQITTTTLTLPAPLALGGFTSFRVRQTGLVSGAPAWSDWSAPLALTAPAPRVGYLVDDADRTSYLMVQWKQDTDRGTAEGFRVVRGLGALSPRVDMVPGSGEQGSLTFQCFSSESRDTLLAWLKAHPVWWMVPPANKGLPQRTIRVSRVSPQRWERRVQSSRSAVYDVPVSWVELI